MMQLDKIPDQISRFLKSGAFYRISSDQIRLFWGPWSPSLEGFDLATQDFFGSDLKGWKAAQVTDFTRGDLIRFLEAGLGGSTQWERSSFVEPSRHSFDQSFQIIQGKIQRGEIEKAVPITFAHSTRSPSAKDLVQTILRVLDYPSELHTFGYWNEGRGILGATPEMLFHRKAMVVQTVALAGSCPRAEVGQRLPLLKDAKEMREHDLVVNDLITRLKPLGWLKKSETDVLELPTLLHLRTRFEISGCAKRDVELVRLLHPTPALGTAPRAYGYQWMRELPEQKDRGMFGAPLLFALGPDETLALVAIRSVLWDETGSRVGAGCGLVASSEIEREWNELAVKRATIFKMMGLE